MTLNGTTNQQLTITKGWSTLTLPLSATLLHHASKTTNDIDVVLNQVNTSNILLSLDLTGAKGQNTLTVYDGVGQVLTVLTLKIKANESIKEIGIPN